MIWCRDFPTNASTILLTAASKYDPDLVAKTKEFVQKGGQAIATTGLIEALGDKGFQDIAEIEVTGHRVLATSFGGGRGGFGGGGRRGGGGAARPAAAPASLNMLLPQMRHFENDTWTGMEFSTADSGYPMVVRAAYGKGTFYALAVPDDFADIYRLPQSVLTQIRSLLGRDLFVSLDAPDHVSLFVYDNRTFIVQNFQSQRGHSARLGARRRPCAIFSATRRLPHRAGRRRRRRRARRRRRRRRWWSRRVWSRRRRRQYIRGAHSGRIHSASLRPNRRPSVADAGIVAVARQGGRAGPFVLGLMRINPDFS